LSVIILTFRREVSFSKVGQVVLKIEHGTDSHVESNNTHKLAFVVVSFGREFT